MDRKLIKMHKLSRRRRADPKAKADPRNERRGAGLRREEAPSPSLPSREWIEQVLR